MMPKLWEENNADTTNELITPWVGDGTREDRVPERENHTPLFNCDTIGGIAV